MLTTIQAAVKCHNCCTLHLRRHQKHSRLIFPAICAAMSQCSSSSTSDENSSTGAPKTHSTTTGTGAGTATQRAEFVKRAQHFEYWQHCTDDIIAREFERAKLVLMVDKRPAMRADCFRQNAETGRWEMRSAPRLAVFDCQELRKKLSLYGLEIGVFNNLNNYANSVLLDIWGRPEGKADGDYQALFGTSIRLEQPPEESGIPPNKYYDELAEALNVRFLDLRTALLIMDEDQKQREWLAKFQSMIRWFRMYLYCPTCKQLLKKRVSSAHCAQCEKEFYPSISPVAITLVRDESDEHALLVRHKGTQGQVFTCIAGFCSVGETLEQTVRREVAEEVGIRCWDIQQLPGSQSWPIPASSLMVPFMATACRQDQLNTSVMELEYAKWFNRAQVLEAIRRVEQDPFMTGLQRHLQSSGKDPEIRRTLRYIPPHGAIAHHIIKDWALHKGKL